MTALNLFRVLHFHSKSRLWYAIQRLICSRRFCSRRRMADTKKDLLSEYIDVNQVETHVLKCGSIRSPESRKMDPQYLFIIIPGNPGIPEYYEEFMHTMWQKSERTIPVWCVCHAGHVTGPKHAGLGWTDIVRQPGPAYTLEGQISHKVNFIRNNVPPDVTLILIGHSIGCYIILNLLPQIPHYTVLRCFMLFPTIERMAQTPNGKVFTPALNYCRWVFTAIVKVLSYLSPKLQSKFIHYYFSDRPGVPDCGRHASLNLFNPVCINHCTYMAKTEMSGVAELQEDLLKTYVDKMSFYYGAVDKWCPKDFCYTIQAKFPDADVRLCQMDFAHAFVLDAGEEMAHLLWDWVSHHL